MNEDLIIKYLGNNPVLMMIAGIGILAVLNLILALIIAKKSATDDIQFHIMPDFLQPLLTYIGFLLMMGILVVSTKGVLVFHAIFSTLEYTALATILAKYFSLGYNKLKKLGLPDDSKLDEVVNNGVNSIVDSNKTSVTSFETTDTTPVTDPNGDATFTPDQPQEDGR